MSKLFNFSSQYFLEKFQQQDRDNVYCPIPTFYKVLDYKDLGKGKDSDPIPKTFPNMLLLQDSAKCIMRKQILWSLGHKTCHNLAHWLVITLPLISTHPGGKTILRPFSCDPSLGGLAALRILWHIGLLEADEDKIRKIRPKGTLVTILYVPREPICP